jgi:hypothetical protein
LPEITKRQKVDRPRFPRFDDGDTVISLTPDETEDLVLHGCQLRQMSGFFASIPAAEWPHRFELVASEDGVSLILGDDDIPADNTLKAQRQQ